MTAQMIREERNTRVFVLDEPGSGGANHEYWIESGIGAEKARMTIQFQKGPVQETGVNGVRNEDLLAIVIHRLQAFQKGPFPCRDNAIALTKCEEALLWLEHRTADRVARGVEGKHEA